ncbi:uncharacterized protein B0H64DRAFT_400071 [Chaetomium fimeti]|uniref:WD-like domain-containing protein n=1 Tax=Chaetomium fimeti TaxID=1854472 RepID=A0AAE0HD75_9PEZI|nr:hypothetical protein B0H64DRAFT_400071 [Chaetomium fimeti]
MKSFAAILALAASTALGAALPSAASSSTASPQPHNLKLVLDQDESGEAVWRLLDENLPAHVAQRRNLGGHGNTSPAAREPRSGSDSGLTKRAAECHNSNRAYSDDCRTLADSIQYSTAPVPSSSRHIAYATCYISWSKVFEGEQSRFWGGAYDTLHDCTGGNPGDTHNYVSGVIRGYLPNGAAQCLSNRAKGCS